MSLGFSTVASPIDQVEYPASDGEPMAETPVNGRVLTLTWQTLEDLLPESTYVGANMFWYWEERNVSANRAPDLMAIKDVGREKRRSFFSWKENGAIPSWILEILAEKTWRIDYEDKRLLYAQLGVKEYFVFDPDGDHIQPSLQGFRLSETGEYVAIEVDAQGRLYSEELGLYLRAEGDVLRFFDGVTGEPILFRHERVELEKQRATAEHQRAEAERQRAQTAQKRAEAEIQRAQAAQQQAETQRQRAEAAQQQAEAERQRTEAAQQQAAAEHERAEASRQQAEAQQSRADALAREVARLRALLTQATGETKPPQS